MVCIYVEARGLCEGSCSTQASQKRILRSTGFSNENHARERQNSYISSRCAVFLRGRQHSLELEIKWHVYPHWKIRWNRSCRRSHPRYDESDILYKSCILFTEFNIARRTSLVENTGIYSTWAGSILTSAGPVWDLRVQLMDTRRRGSMSAGVRTDGVEEVTYCRSRRSARKRRWARRMREEIWFCECVWIWGPSR